MISTLAQTVLISGIILIATAADLKKNSAKADTDEYYYTYTTTPPYTTTAYTTTPYTTAYTTTPYTTAYTTTPYTTAYTTTPYTTTAYTTTPYTTTAYTTTPYTTTPYTTTAYTTTPYTTKYTTPYTTKYTTPYTTKYTTPYTTKHDPYDYGYGSCGYRKRGAIAPLVTADGHKVGLVKVTLTSGGVTARYSIKSRKCSVIKAALELKKYEMSYPQPSKFACIGRSKGRRGRGRGRGRGSKKAVLKCKAAYFPDIDCCDYVYVFTHALLKCGYEEVSVYAGPKQYVCKDGNCRYFKILPYAAGHYCRRR